MSSNYWQTKKLARQFLHGNTTASKVESYIQTWRKRCYSDDIPDEVPAKIAASNRAPSYKAIAMCLLKNDLLMKGLGFDGKHTEYFDQLKSIRADADRKQDTLFDE